MSNSTTKKDLISSIYISTKSDASIPSLSYCCVNKIVDIVFDKIANDLSDKNTVKIKNFGSFVTKVHKETKRRNNKTGQIYLVPAKRVITFRPSKALKERVKTKL